VLAHQDDDEAFYAYVDKMHEAKAVVYDAVFEWFQGSNPHQFGVSGLRDPKGGLFTGISLITQNPGDPQFFNSLISNLKSPGPTF